MPVQVLAVIPARGGSKGIIGKNLRIVGGRPLVAHSILAAAAARHVTRLVVSTDDEEIARVSEAFGAQVVRRPAALASDTSRSEDALLHVLDVLERDEAFVPDVVLLIQCTSPLTTAQDIDGTVEALLADAADTSVAVAPFHYFLWARDENGASIALNHDKTQRLMRQQRRPEFIETGAVYAMRTAGFRVAGHRFFGTTVLHETPVENRLEIDELPDLELAEERLRTRMAIPARAGQAGTRFKVPAAIIFDFDGVHTDDRVFVDQDGRESVVCSRRDGMGVERLRKLGMPMVVLSKETNAVVAARCAKLRLEHFQGVECKLELLRQWIARNELDASACMYVGNDTNDVECMQYVGMSAAPRDAHPSAIAAARLVLDADGGRGAVRLLADLIEAALAGAAQHAPAPTRERAG
ncbi:acylneuraminate cytidylyltransferase [Novosphingobium album (ex Liu et al. 2023)]|uniref:N-acylneuraminate cytidylyltransferase n=1 Tax=Novosphingobium album (ex Liu et al. 2023) TaxID=3031130 RepID=A0ABT5WTH6_9SPHN|nr:acylneuraminate cytidylyltransferase [Novosphingobium album (ex Liu et al. 2023)]MDE8653190.1 acylneuraminate cytidylyltransferase [Novosphingobium album (ex Liu et al. 2023)]